MLEFQLHDAEARSVIAELNHIYDGTYEFHPFLIQWYNEVVTDHDTFDLPFGHDVLAITVFTLPAFFERIYVPWLRSHYESTMRDPVDKCFKEQMCEVSSKLRELLLNRKQNKSSTALSNDCNESNNNKSESVTSVSLSVPAPPTTNNEEQELEIRTVYDFELNPVRRSPRVIMQVAAHVSGGAFYYRPADVPEDRLAELTQVCGKSLAGVSLHARFGGWFAMRAVLVLPGCHATLCRRAPADPLGDDVQAKLDLLAAWTQNWRDPAWRNALGRLQVSETERYSDAQTRYFASAASDRERRRIIEAELLGCEYSNGQELLYCSKDSQRLEQLKLDQCNG